MKTRLLPGMLCLLAGPLWAQPQLAVRIDTTAAAPVLVPVPAAVLAVCRQVAPEIAASPAASWSVARGGYFATAPGVLYIPGIADTLHYSLEALFGSDGRIYSFDKEIPANRLPFRIRWVLRHQLACHRSACRIVLAVVNVHPYSSRRSRQALYTVWAHPIGIQSLPVWRSFWRNGQPVKEPHYR